MRVNDPEFQICVLFYNKAEKFGIVESCEATVSLITTTAGNNSTGLTINK